MRHDDQAPDDEGRSGAEKGQIIILFAMFSTVLIGMLGLAMDLGFAFSQKRTVQNAADAGALAGARVVSRPLLDLLSAQAEVDEFAGIGALNTKNKMETANQTIKKCDYVNDAGASINVPCTVIVPATAKGVMVEVSETHDTFFIQVVPGAPDSVTTTATAIAHVRDFKGALNSPFILCGYNTWDVTGDLKTAMKGVSMNLLIEEDPYKKYSINPLAYGKTFRVHDNSLSHDKIADAPADCTTGPRSPDPSASWMGLAATDASNNNLPVPGWWNYDSGLIAGPTRASTPGVDGCKAGEKPEDCVMLLPVAWPERDKAAKKVFAAMFAPFYITAPTVNSHNATLLEHYSVSGKSGDSWCRTCSTINVIRLTQ